MIELLFVGRLGLDAAVENESIRLRIAVNNTRVIEGERVEETQWITCFSPIDRLKGLLPFLKKGCKVFVSGRPRFSCYSSPIAKKFVPDVSVWVNSLQMLDWGSSNDAQKNEEKSEDLSNCPY